MRLPSLLVLSEWWNWKAAYELNDYETLDFDIKKLLQDIYLQYMLTII